MKKVICKNYGENVKQRVENPQILKFFRMRPNASKCIPVTRPSRSKRIRMDPNTSENLEKSAKMSKKFAKTSKSLRENFDKFFSKINKKLIKSANLRFGSSNLISLKNLHNEGIKALKKNKYCLVKKR